MIDMLNVTSLNIRGLHLYMKRKLLTEYFRLVKAHVLFLQETYLT